MTHKLSILLIAFSLLLGQENPSSAYAMMVRVSRNPHPESTVSNLILTMKHRRGNRLSTKVRELTRYQKNYTNGQFRSKIMMRFIKPAVAKGIGVLTWNYRDGHSDQWLFLPKLHAAKQIAGGDQSKSLLGTEFTYEDLKETVPDSVNLRYVGGAMLDSISCEIVDQQMPKSSQYSHRRIWIDPRNWLVKKVEYYNNRQKMVKVLNIMEHVKKGQFWFAKKMIMRNLENGNESVLEMEDIRVNSGIVDDFFTQKFLIKID